MVSIFVKRMSFRGSKERLIVLKKRFASWLLQHVPVYAQRPEHFGENSLRLYKGLSCRSCGFWLRKYSPGGEQCLRRHISFLRKWHLGVR